MERHSFTISFVSGDEARGTYMLYVTKTRWLGGRCIKTEAVYTKRCKRVPERDEYSNDLDWAAEMADRAWNEVVAARSAERHQAKEEITPTGE